MRHLRKSVNLLGAALIAGGLAAVPQAAFAQAVNPCAPKAANPCAAKFEVDAKLVTRPAGTKLVQGKHSDLAKEGEKLFKDTKLSTNGMACGTCHANNDNFMATFTKPYPHEVEMAKEKGGVAKVHLDEMVQFCMVVPMATKPLPWDSRQLAVLTTYTADLQKKFQADAKKAANPCAPKAANPCAPKAANPCAPKAANPCAKK
ncbi:MAG: cytochrome C peroxidase [Pseudomonadota bacterium]